MSSIVTPSAWALGTDLSENNTADLAIISQYIDFVIWRASIYTRIDKGWLGFIGEAVKYPGLILGAYHVPAVYTGGPDGADQWALHRSFLPLHVVNMTGLDIEEQTDDTQTARVVQEFYNAARTDPDWADILFYFYTRSGWLAAKPKTKATIDAILDADPRAIFWAAGWVLRPDYTVPPYFQPVTWAGLPSWLPNTWYTYLLNEHSPRLWQFTAHLTGLEGLENHQVDLNYFHGTATQLRELAKAGPIIPEGPGTLAEIGRQLLDGLDAGWNDHTALLWLAAMLAGLKE